MKNRNSSPNNYQALSSSEAPAGSRLGTYGSMVGRSAGNHDQPWQEKRRTIWSLSRTAAGLLYPVGTPKTQLKGVATCRWAVKSKALGVDVHLSQYEGTNQKRASFAGLQTCGLLWQCPACAARISETRRRQLNEGLAWAKAQGHRIAMITLTARHGEEDELKDLLGRMKRAKRRLHQHRAWKRIKPEIVAKPITATEVTYGRNGWHPHFHMLVIVETDDAAFELEGLGNAWRGALRAEGLSGAGAAFDCQGATEAGQYVGKWGAGEELTLSGKKRAKGKGKTPLQLLEAHKAGNPETGQLWLEYVEAFRGRTQLDGLKALVDIAGLDDLTDAEAALDQEQEGQEREEEPIANIDNDTWRERGRIRRTDILDAAESNGAAGVWSVIDGVTVSKDLAQPPPPRPGGLIDQLLDDLIESVSPP